MKNTNIGIANLVISNKLKESYFNDNLIEESKKLTLDFFNIVKNSPILQLEFKVFNNIENKHIDNDLVATRYIDNNIRLFEVYTIAEIDAEREKLNAFIDEGRVPIDDYKVQLYNAIDNLIKESLNDYSKIDVDNIHESFTFVLNHVKEPKHMEAQLVENVEDVNEEIVEIAVDKFNQKYESLNEDDKNLLQLLIKSNDKEKEQLLESFKSESLTILEGINKDTVKENILKAIQKIKEMKYNKANVVDDIISLHELKRDLL
jgi:hypothetical protein